MTRANIAIGTIATLLLVSAAGCNQADPAGCLPVSGRVLLQGQPVAEAMVVFHPEYDAPVELPKPIGFTDAEGRFQLTTLQTRDGAPAGKYAVTVELREVRMIGDELTRDGRNLLPPRYASPSTTVLHYTVSQAVQEPVLFELTNGG